MYTFKKCDSGFSVEMDVRRAQVEAVSPAPAVTQAADDKVSDWAGSSGGERACHSG